MINRDPAGELARGIDQLAAAEQQRRKDQARHLVKYEAARQALAEASRVDEVKDIRDKAVAMQVYAQQAKDRTLIEHATEIRLRAERRAGELLREMEKNKGAIPGKTGSKARPVLDPTPKLADIGVTKTQSSRWQQLAKMPDEKFEAKVVSIVEQHVAALDGTGSAQQAADRRSKDSTPVDPIKKCVIAVGKIINDAVFSEAMRSQVKRGKLFDALYREIDKVSNIAIGGTFDQVIERYSQRAAYYTTEAKAIEAQRKKPGG